MALSDEERKVKRKAYDARPEAKVNRKAYQQRPEAKTRQKEIRDDLKMDVFSYYSKIQSNSDIPCCRCCGLTSHMAFLGLDHIAGRKKMDFELELVKLGYSSKMKSTSLLKWIKKNNFPNTFQILCHNCNFAKGHSKDNKCSLEGKPH